MGWQDLSSAGLCPRSALSSLLQALRTHHSSQHAVFLTTSWPSRLFFPWLYCFLLGSGRSLCLSIFQESLCFMLLSERVHPWPWFMIQPSLPSGTFYLYTLFIFLYSIAWCLPLTYTASRHADWWVCLYRKRGRKVTRMTALPGTWIAGEWWHHLLGWGKLREEPILGGEGREESRYSFLACY